MALSKDVYFEMAAREIRALSKLEGTVHVNMALVVKFMKNFLFNLAPFPTIPKRDDAADDDFLFRQGPTGGLSKVLFHDYRIAYDSMDLPNLAVFKEQIEAFKRFLMAPPQARSRAVTSISF